MTDLSLNEDMNLQVMARFVGKGHEASLTGDAYTVRLYDMDIFEDDSLGESTLDKNGIAKISFTHSSFSDWSTENKPDFHFVLYKNKNEIFQSKVLEDLDIDTIERFKMGEGKVIDLGTFLIDG